jgi:hypothetical protein
MKIDLTNMELVHFHSPSMITHLEIQMDKDKME